MCTALELENMIPWRERAADANIPDLHKSQNSANLPSLGHFTMLEKQENDKSFTCLMIEDDGRLNSTPISFLGAWKLPSVCRASTFIVRSTLPCTTGYKRRRFTYPYLSLRRIPGLNLPLFDFSDLQAVPASVAAKFIITITLLNTSGYKRRDIHIPLLYR